MEQSKPSAEELQKLLELAVSEGPEGEDALLSDVERFILLKGIKPGTALVPAAFIWLMYKEFLGNPEMTHDQGWFFRSFSKRFQRKRWGHTRYYLLDPEPFDLSLDTYWRARADWRVDKERYRNERERRRKEEDEKKLNEVPGPGEGSESQE